LRREESGSMSERVVSRFEVRTRLVRCGAVVCKVGEMLEMRLRANRSVWRRGERGMFVSAVMELSVRSIESWSRATPKFSMAGILWPTIGDKWYQ